MRQRVIGSSLVGAGVFALVLAVVLPTVVYPRLALLPVDPDKHTVARGTGFSVFLPRSEAEGGSRVHENVSVTSRVRATADPLGPPPAPGSPTVTWQIATRTDVEGVGLLSATLEGVTLDRRTARTSDAGREYLITDEGDPQGEPLRHEGYAVTFPMNTQKIDHPMWDTVIRGTALAVYRGEEERRGFRTYRFEQVVPDQPVGAQDLPGRFFGFPDDVVPADVMYATRRTYWVLPATGSVVDYRQEMNRRFVYEGVSVPVIQGTLELQPAGAAAMDRLRRTATTLTWVRGRIAFVLVPLGLIAVLVGLRLLVPGRPRRTGTGARGAAHRDDDHLFLLPPAPAQRGATRRG